MATYLLKTEPSVYSYDDLVREKRTWWNGVTNPAALINLRKGAVGDSLWIYHTGDERAIVGLAKCVGAAKEDPEKPGLNTRGEPKFAVLEAVPVQALARPVTLDEMKADKRFAGFELLRLARLSVVEVPPAIDRLIRELAGVKPPK